MGHLFQSRFKSVLVEAEDHLHVLTRYIHMNPVRAGIVRMPEEYRWSSYRDYLGIRQCPKWLDVKQTLEMFGVSEKEQKKYNLWEAQQNRENQKILAGVPTLKDLESTLKG